MVNGERKSCISIIKLSNYHIITLFHDHIISLATRPLLPARKTVLPFLAIRHT